MLTTVAQDCLQVQRNQRRLLLGLLLVALPALAQVPTGTATFVKTDISTAGTWKGVYGADGFNVIGDSASVPGYVTVTPSGNSSWVWASSTSDTRALQKASVPADRIAACWYSPTSFTINLAFNDSNTHQVAVYLVDWDNYNGRTERVDVIDANNNLLDTRSVASFVPGEYLVWNLSGHVILRVTNTNPSSNAVVSGLFFGAGSAPPPLPPTGAASFVKTDTTTAGTWKGGYGADGFNVIGDSASVPAYVTVTASGSSSWVWASSTSDTRALQKASVPADRIAVCWYSPTSFTINLAFNDSNTHQVAVYLVDWDNYNGRTERVDVIDANNNLLDTRSVASFVPGKYLVWNLRGHMILRVTNTNPSSNAVVSGLFFGTGSAPPPLPPTGAASFVKTDTTTAGTWKGGYGADGFNVIGDSASVPAYVTVTPAGNSSYVWASSTSDTRALQKASSPADRIAACWYSPTSFTINLAFNDSNTHQVAVYLVDWDNYNGRTERVDVIDANNNLLDARSVASFVPGKYLVWNLSGHVILRVTNTNLSSNAVVSGLFFGTLQPTVSVSVSPSSVNLLAGGSQQFSTTVLGSANTSVIWSLSSPVGTINATGLYAAPATLSSQQTVTVRAASLADPTRSATATVTLNPPVNVTASPASVALTQSQTQSFSVTVTNTSNTAVTWSLSPVVGSVTAAGLYTAPASITSSQTVTVKATSAADSTKSATATVTLNPLVGVTVSPGSVNLTQSQTQSFSATVTSTGNTAVTWSLSPLVGSITAAGLYTAPASIASSQTVTVKATSAADPTKSATAAVTLNPPVSVTVSPASVTLTQSQSQSFSATVTNTGNTAVTWSVSPVVGSITAAGLYTAPASITSSQTVTVKATSAADSTRFATAAVTLTPAVTVSLTPSTVSLLPSRNQTFAATVSGTSSTGVTWSMSPDLGSLASNATTAVYVAPSTAPTIQSVIIAATSMADPSRTAAAVITLLQAITVSLSPSTVSLAPSGTQQLTATVLGTSNTAVTWSINPPVGTISSAGLYTTPSSILASQTVTVTARSVADPTKSATAAVSLSPPVTISTGTFTYYVDSANGSDSNPGTLAEPWKTIAKVNATRLSPGQSVAFQSGGVWRETLTPGQSGTAGNPITFTSYGTGAAPRILGSVALGGASWTNAGGNIWSTSVASLPDGVVLNGTTLVAPQASEGALTTQGQYFANSSTIYIYSTTAPSSYYSSIEAILRDGIDIGRNYINVSGIATWYGIIGVNENVGGDALNNVNLTNLDSEYNSRQGVLLANLWTELTNPATNLNISYSTVSNNGYHGIHYTFYVTNSICSYNTVNNNGTTPAIASMGGEGIEVYGRNSDVYINHITVTHNTVTNTQSVTTWGEGQGIQSDGYSAYVTISYNTVYGNMGVGIAMTPPSHNATVVYNVVYGNGSALTNEGGISVNDDYGSLIANNTVYNNYGQGFVLWNTSSINTTVKNNIFQANGTTEIEVSTSVTGWLSDYNDYYHPAGGSSYMNWLLTGYTFSGWQSASSQDANSLGSNPMLNNPSGGDFTLQSGSAAINAGACINGVTPCPTNIGAK